MLQLEIVLAAVDLAVARAEWGNEGAVKVPVRLGEHLDVVNQLDGQLVGLSVVHRIVVKVVELLHISVAHNGHLRVLDGISLRGRSKYWVQHLGVENAVSVRKLVLDANGELNLVQGASQDIFLELLSHN